MALFVDTPRPQDLLDAIYKAIDNKTIQTWEYDKDRDLTHSPDQWKNKAWMHPTIKASQLQFGLLGQKNIVMSKLIYAVYHGRFAEMLLNHFDDKITNITASASKHSSDSF